MHRHSVCCIVKASLACRDRCTDYQSLLMQVLPGSSIALSMKLMHQPCNSPPQSAASGISIISSNVAASSAKSAGDAKAAAEAGGSAVPVLEPLTLVSADEAAGCNVLTFSPQLARPLPPQMISAAHTANGAITCTVALHLPGSGHNLPLLTCSGGCVRGEHLTWTESRRIYLSPSAVQALKVLQQQSQFLLLCHCCLWYDRRHYESERTITSL